MTSLTGLAPVARQLKEGTGNLHVEAERHVRILDPDADLAAYARFLSRMLGFHAPLEARLGEHPGLAAVGFAAHTRRKSAWLASDLIALGYGAEVPMCAALPPVDDTAAAIGAAYVVEGSTLGGRFVLSRMNPALSQASAGATRFLQGYREATGAQWKAFVAIAEGLGSEEGAAARAVAGARATFAALIDWLDEPAREPPFPYWPPTGRATEAS